MSLEVGKKKKQPVIVYYCCTILRIYLFYYSKVSVIH